MAKQTVQVTVEFQVRIPGFEGQASKTFEYSVEGWMKAAQALEADQFEREAHVLRFIAKEFKGYAKAEMKKLEKKKKAAKKNAA